MWCISVHISKFRIYPIIQMTWRFQVWTFVINTPQNHFIIIRKWIVPANTPKAIYEKSPMLLDQIIFFQKIAINLTFTFCIFINNLILIYFIGQKLIDLVKNEIFELSFMIFNFTRKSISPLKESYVVSVLAFDDIFCQSFLSYVWWDAHHFCHKCLVFVIVKLCGPN